MLPLPSGGPARTSAFLWSARLGALSALAQGPQMVRSPLGRWHGADAVGCQVGLVSNDRFRSRRS